ncbi:hypothetical protein Tsubulata_034053, partial [Turnera subulata]
VRFVPSVEQIRKQLSCMHDDLGLESSGQPVSILLGFAPGLGFRRTRQGAAGPQVFVVDSDRPIHLHNLSKRNESVVALYTSGDEKVAGLGFDFEVSNLADMCNLDYVDEEDDSESEEEDSESEGEEGDEEDGSDRSPRRKKRRRVGGEEDGEELFRRWKREYYHMGSFHGKTSGCLMYDLSHSLRKDANNELLWLACVSLTDQFVHQRLTDERYHDGVMELEQHINSSPRNLKALTTVTLKDGTKIQESGIHQDCLEWNLFESMLCSSYIAPKLKTWTDKGKKNLMRLLAEMGFAIKDCQVGFQYMNLVVKRKMKDEFEGFLPGCGLTDFYYKSFLMLHGFGMQKAISVQKAILSQGGAAITKVRSERKFRWVKLEDSVDAKLLGYPQALTKFCYFLMDALMERGARAKPMICTCISQEPNKMLIVGVCGKPRQGAVQGNAFGSAFRNAAQEIGADFFHELFESSWIVFEKSAANKEWNLFESMLCSSYIAPKLKTWTDKGKKNLMRLLAEMGFTIKDCQVGFQYMNLVVKRKMKDEFERFLPECGLTDFYYKSFDVAWKAILIQGGAAITKVRSERKFRWVKLEDSVDAKLLGYPQALTKFCYFLMDALMERGARAKPMICACISQEPNKMLIVGVCGKPRQGAVQGNAFGSAFRNAAQEIEADFFHELFESSWIVLEKSAADNYGERGFGGVLLLPPLGIRHGGPTLSFTHIPLHIGCRLTLCPKDHLPHPRIRFDPEIRKYMKGGPDDLGLESSGGSARFDTLGCQRDLCRVLGLGGGEGPDGPRVFVVDSHCPIHLHNLSKRNESVVVLYTSGDEKMAGLGFDFEVSGLANMCNLDYVEEESEEEEEEDSKSEEEDGSDGSPWKKRRRVVDDDEEAFKRWRKEYYHMGSFHGQPSGCLMYDLSHSLRKDTNNELLWFACLSLTDQFVHQRLTDERYQVGVTELELHVSSRNLGSYIAPKLETGKGKKKLTRLLAEMGFAIAKCETKFLYMDYDIKRKMKDEFEHLLPERGLTHFYYRSFFLSHGYTYKVSTADVVYGVTALLESFANSDGSSASKLWGMAYDAMSLNNLDKLRSGMQQAILVQRAILGQGSAAITKVRSERKFWWVKLEDLMDAKLLGYPQALTRFCYFLMDVLRERGARAKPMICACVSQEPNKMLIVGVYRKPRQGAFQGNAFGAAFKSAAEEIGADFSHELFNSSWIVLEKSVANKFIVRLNDKL